MTDRHSGYVIALAEDIREDDAEAVLTALRMVKGVMSVTPIISDGHADIVAMRVDRHWRERIEGLLRTKD